MTGNVNEIIPPSYESLEPKTDHLIISRNGKFVQLTPDSPTIPAGDYFKIKVTIEIIARQQKTL